MRFSLFTPVHNRRDTIHRVWESALSQTLRDFEWIVVDDGSEDGVQDVLDRYRSEAPFPVRIVAQPHRGKHAAWNAAVRMARGELFVPCDSDDAFVPRALERFSTLWDEIPEEDRKRCSGINVLCLDPETGQVLGSAYPRDRFFSNNLELDYVLRVTGEKWGCIRSDLLRRLPFPEVRGRFFPENFLWYSLAREYRVLCVNEPLRYYYQDRPDRLMGGDRRNEGWEVEHEYLIWHMKNNRDFIGLRKSEWFRNMYNVWRTGFMAGRSIRQIARRIEGRRLFACALPFLLLGLAVTWRDKIRSGLNRLG